VLGADERFRLAVTRHLSEDMDDERSEEEHRKQGSAGEQ